MPLTLDQARPLAATVHALRPDWDTAGILSALQRCAGRNEFDVAVAAIKAAADPGAKTPGVIPSDGPHWRERVSAERTPRNPMPHEECRAHLGQFRGSCSGCRADALAHDIDTQPHQPMTRDQALAHARETVAAARRREESL